MTEPENYALRQQNGPGRPGRYRSPCLTCLRTRSISEHSEERTLLLSDSVILNEPRCHDKALIAVFLGILLFGSSIGVYLLIIQKPNSRVTLQSRPLLKLGSSLVVEEFDFVLRQKWIKNTSFIKNLTPLQRPVSKIFLLEVSSYCNGTRKTCFEYERYSDKNKEKIRTGTGEVLYNFYQYQDGKVFEGRGWSYESDCGQLEGCGDVLTIALLEDPKSFPPSISQISKLKAFLDYCIMNHALKPCYEILVQQNPNRYFDDVAFKIDKMIRDQNNCFYYV